MFRHLRDLHHLLRYGNSGPQSYERIAVDPMRVNRSYTKHRPDVPKLSRRHSGLILGGHWDLATRDIDNSPKIRACRQHFEDGLSWADTGIYDYMLDKIAREGAFDSCRSYDDVVERYGQIDALYQSIRSDGAMRSTAHARYGHAREKGGVFIHIDRDGAPIFGMVGNHRMAIARCLRLPVMPAQLGVIHAQAFEAGHLEKYRWPLGEAPPPPQG